MFNALKIIAVMSATIMLGQAPASFGQDQTAISPEKKSVSLAPKACALFVWIDGSQTPRLASTDTGAFGFDTQNKYINFKEIYKSNADDFGQYARQDLDDGSGNLYQLHLGPPTRHADMILYRAGTWTQPNEDGWLQIKTAKAVSTCNASEDILDIIFDAVENFIHAPQGVIHPDNIQTETPAPITNTPVINIDPPVIVQNTETQIQPPPAPIIAPPILQETAPPSPYTVQIGSFRQEARALIHLTEVRKTAPYIDDYQTEIQTSPQKDNTLFYRLRLTALTNRAQAVKLCQRLKADGIDCFVP